jgi:HK97 family phage portal protein
MKLPKLPAIFSRVFGGKSMQAVDDRFGRAGVAGQGGWFRVLEPFTGAWQRNLEVSRESVLANSAVYGCVTLIASDISKLQPHVMQQQSGGVWREVESKASRVLARPNTYQNRIQFFGAWITSKLLSGNCYVLLDRDDRGVVTAMHVLDPLRVRPLVSDGGDVYYELKPDRLPGVFEPIVVPARMVIHDRMLTLHHHLVGVSPLFAAALAAQEGVNIQAQSASFFGNRSMPGGILTAPGHIEDETAARVKEAFEQGFGGANFGRTVVLGDGLEFKALAMLSAESSQLIEQLKWTAETVCSCFHVPPFMIGVGTMPAYNNIEALSQAYYSQCLQALIESLELSLDDGLDLAYEGQRLSVEFDLDGLLRMDTSGRFKAYSDAIGAGWLSPNEARRREGLDPVEGGNTPYMQQQNFSLAALARRDQNNPPPTST